MGHADRLVGFAANLSIALLLQHGAKDDLNIRSAFWHMLSDAWVSLGVVVSGGVILLTGWWILDPLVSLLVVSRLPEGPGRSLRNHLKFYWSPLPPVSAPQRSRPPSNPFRCKECP